MNPEFHDVFVALVPLFYSGELTDEEWALLQVHMAYCDSCREAFEQHEHIASAVIPAMAASAAAESQRVREESNRSLYEAERQLMGRLEARNSVSQQQTFRAPRAWISAGAIAACIIGALAYTGIRYVRPLPKQQIAETTSVASAPPASSSVPEAQPKANHEALGHNADKISSLEGRLSQAEKRAAEFHAAVAAEKHQLQTEEAQKQQLLGQRDSLNQQLAAAQTDAQVLRQKLAIAQTGAGQQTALVTELETKVRRLNAAVDEANASLDSKDRIIAFDKDLMLHDRDIRDVIGARNLYIADIYDTTSNGRTAKPFGRIFYTKDSSLVFYGFDLDKQAGIKQSATFQAWGSGTDRRPVSLGLFYQDDGHKRWILKCKDAATLARLNMVFVTIEPPGGSSKPTGKQFLRAYLQIQPNHP